METSLTPRDRVLLMALMALNEEVTNAVLKERAGLTLEGKDRRRLNDLKLVSSGLRGRAYWHELTDDGWNWCRQEMGSVAPSRSDAGTRGLYLVLASLRRYLDSADLQLADVFGIPAAPPSVEPPSVEPPSVEPSSDAPRSGGQPLAERLRGAYHRLAARQDDWVSLSEVRRLLDGADRGEVDEELRRLEAEGAVHLVPETDQRRLTEQDRAAAVRIGGKDKHLLRIEGA